MNQTPKFSAIIRSQFLSWMNLFFDYERSEPICWFDLEPASFLPLRTSTCAPTSNLFDHFSGVDRTIRDALTDFAIAISLARSVLNAKRYIWGASTANLGVTPKIISNGNFPSIPGLLLYPPSISARHPSYSRSLLPTKTFCIARFNVPTILSTLAFPLGL